MPIPHAICRNLTRPLVVPAGSDPEAGLITPDQIAGLLAWYRADSLTLADGAAVAAWPDSSGNGHTASQATGANQPVFKTAALGGQPVLRFAGTTQYLQTAAFASVPQPITAAACYRKNSSGASTAGFLFDGQAGTNRLALLEGDGAPNAGLFAGTTVTDGAASLVQGNPYIISALYNGAASFAWLNGAAYLTNVNPGSISTIGFTIGNEPGITRPLNGDLGELILYSRALSTSERGQIESYLSQKFGIAVLPA